MKTDFLIIGQGIAGTLLSYYLLKAGRSVVVLDNGAMGNASHVAAAVINPLSGKQWTPSPDAALFIPEALSCYRHLEELLLQPLLRLSPMYIFGAEQQYPTLISCGDEEQKQLQRFFSRAEHVCKNERSYLVEATALLQGWKEYLLGKSMLWQEQYEHKDCVIGDQGVRYKDLEAKKIIFCEGAAALQNPLWAGLPFTRNRGEALLLRIPGLSQRGIYHNKLRLVPRAGELFWYGSNYQWSFTDLEPDKNWRAEAIAGLEAWLKLPFEVADHIVAERPTTAGQVPLVGLHPRMPSVGIFNGLGTRGFSAGPFWAAELARKLTAEAYVIRNYAEDRLAAKLR
jgi:glycine/D-amino acid oxidase-like deaminating enzyme